MLARKVPLSLVALIVALAGCETTHRVGQSATVRFGTVRSAETVQLESAAAQGAIVGGMLGLVSGGRNRSSTRNAIQGAAIGGIAGGAAQGNRTAMAYTIEMLDGSITRVVTDQREIKPGDCVAVERVGDTANVRRRDPDYCQPANRQAVAAVERENATAAVACEDAKEELSAATTEAEVDLASRKIHLLCDN